VGERVRVAGEVLRGLNRLAGEGAKAA
jgi:hypothetical protein